MDHQERETRRRSSGSARSLLRGFPDRLKSIFFVRIASGSSIREAKTGFSGTVTRNPDRSACRKYYSLRRPSRRYLQVGSFTPQKLSILNGRSWAYFSLSVFWRAAVDSWSIERDEPFVAMDASSLSNFVPTC